MDIGGKFRYDEKVSGPSYKGAQTIVAGHPGVRVVGCVPYEGGKGCWFKNDVTEVYTSEATITIQFLMKPLSHWWHKRMIDKIIESTKVDRAFRHAPTPRCDESNLQVTPKRWETGAAVSGEIAINWSARVENVKDFRCLVNIRVELLGEGGEVLFSDEGISPQTIEAHEWKMFETAGSQGGYIKVALVPQVKSWRVVVSRIE
ncbi:MAG: hypothetical protein ACOYXU_01735 [Nitrospirota bacterium]